MKRVILLIAVVVFSSIKCFSADINNNKSAIMKENPKMIAEIITDFYMNKCNGKEECTKCYRDYTFSKDENYYCLKYNKNEANKLKGKENCNKEGVCNSEVEDVYTFNRKNKLSSYLYWYENGGNKPVNVKYSYDMKGRIKSEKEKDKSTSKILGDTVVTYKYRGDEQIITISERKLDFPPIFKKEKVLETKKNDCRTMNCQYAQSFMPQVELP